MTQALAGVLRGGSAAQVVEVDVGAAVDESDGGEGELETYD